MARQGKARQGKVSNKEDLAAWATIIKPAKPSAARLGKAWHGTAWLGMAGPGKARIGVAWPGRAGHGKARFQFKE